MSALQKLAKGAQSQQAASKETLEDVVVLSLTNWPETMLPNKLVGVLQDLSETAHRSTSSSSRSSSRVSWPLLKELAADVSLIIIICVQFQLLMMNEFLDLKRYSVSNSQTHFSPMPK